MERVGDQHHVLMIDRDEDESVVSVKKKLRSIDSIFRQYQACTIYRVIPYVQLEDNTSYHPKIISIGPFHRGKQSLLAMENLKLRYLQDFLCRCQGKKPLHKFIAAVRKMEVEVRKQYSEDVNIESNAFVEMLVLDGCFLIEFLLKWYSGDIRGHLCIADWSSPLLRKDILLLENQIPFIVPQTLYSIAQGMGANCPSTFLQLSLSYLTRRTYESLPRKSDIETYHLLHLLHTSLDPELEPKNERTLSFWKTWQTKIQKFLHLKSSSRKLTSYQSTSSKASMLQQFVPAAVDLQEAGVIFEKKETEHCFLKVEFVDGKLVIPCVAINSSMVSLLLNLLTFEQSRIDIGNYVTCYIAFMDSIVNTPGDVAVLQGCQIIKGQLGSDENVALFFNTLGGGVPHDWRDDHNYLADVVHGVNKYCKNRRHRDLAALKKKYFVTPWSIISMAAGSVLLLLTAAQTIFTILSYSNRAPCFSAAIPKRKHHNGEQSWQKRVYGDWRRGEERKGACFIKDSEITDARLCFVRK